MVVTVTPAQPGVRGIRADARRSIESLLAAARDTFATSGVHAPVREIAERAGVGVATVYRHFPLRTDLISAVFQQEIQSCADAAAELAAENDPLTALRSWLERYTALLATKRGLAAALNSDAPTFEDLPACFQEPLLPALQSLLTAASRAGQARADVSATELLQAVATLCLLRDTGQAARMVALLIDGLRPTGTSQP
jgi:AcrR family transcriptional regulator